MEKCRIATASDLSIYNCNSIENKWQLNELNYHESHRGNCIRHRITEAPESILSPAEWMLLNPRRPLNLTQPYEHRWTSGDQSISIWGANEYIPILSFRQDRTIPARVFTICKVMDRTTTF